MSVALHQGALATTFKKFDLQGRTAVVTAGGTGIGYHLTKALAQAGAKVLICSRREQVLKQAAERLRADASSDKVLYHTVDLADHESIKALADHAHKALGGVDIFVGNAAEVGMEHLDNITQPTLERIMQVNFSANVELTRLFLPHMRKQKWGRVMFSSTVGSLAASPHEGMCIYGASKGALNAFVRTAATETGRDGITVNSMIFGFYVTEMMRQSCEQLDRTHPGASKAFVEGYASMTAVGRMGECHELEGVIQLLASNAGSYITGSSLVIDGGMSIMLRPNSTTT